MSADAQAPSGAAAPSDPPPAPPTPVPSAQQRPEVAVGAAFAGGLAAALLLRGLRGRR